MSGHDMAGMEGHDMGSMDDDAATHDHGTTGTDHTDHGQTPDTVSPQMRTLVLTGFGSVNGAVVVAAFLIRRQRPARPRAPADERRAAGPTATGPTATGPTRPATATTGRNLLDTRLIGGLMRSRWYPGIFQVPVAMVFGFVAYELLTGPSTAHDNAGTALMWVLWWPVVPITFLLLGRFWCAVCPFATLSDLVQKYVGLHRPVPRFLKVYGIWVIDASFLAITWADHVWGIVGSPWRSGSPRRPAGRASSATSPGSATRSSRSTSPRTWRTTCSTCCPRARPSW